MSIFIWRNSNLSKEIKFNEYERKERFGKYSKSLFSALIGSSIILPMATMEPAFATGETNKEISVEYNYVVESELSQKEKESLRLFVAKDEIPSNEKAYYFVYRKQEVSSASPKTSDNTPLGINMLLAGGALLVLAVYVTKGDKKKVRMSLFALSLIGSMYITQVDALQARILGEYKEQVKLMQGEDLPDPPKSIKGYDFTGYFLTLDRGVNQGNDTTQITPNNDNPSDNTNDGTLNPENPGNKPGDSTKPTEPEPVITTENVEIEFPVIENPDTSLDKDVRIVDVKGEKGIKKVTKTNGIITSEEIIKEPVAERVRVGAKEVTFITEEETVEIPFAVIEESDNDLWEGESETLVSGVNGKKLIIKKYMVENGVKSDTPISVTENIILNPVNQIVKRGTKPVAGTEEVVSYEDIDFETERVEDKDLYIDQLIVDSEGEKGQRKITKVYATEKGVRTETEI